MRNLKRALSLGLTAAMISGLMVMGSSAASYADVADTDNVEAIEVLEAVGIMIGDENGNFNPDQNVTRNEMAVIMSNLMAYNVATYSGTSPFTDVPSWAEPYVAACWTNGITAGTSDTTYGGDQTVTTAQAALMIMKALGYFQYSSDFGSDWQLSTVSQGNKIDLFNDVTSGVKEAMTRNDVAQLVLNGLESGTVEAETSGSITVGDTTIVSGVKYNYITSGQSYAYAINPALETNNDATTSSGSIVELGEKLYQGDLMKKGGQDDFGRPAATWSYDNKEIGTYADEADYSYTKAISHKDLYNTLGATAVGYNWSVYYNGEDLDSVKPIKNKTDDYANTATGTLTEVFVDNVDKTVTVTMVDTFLAEVVRVQENESDVTVTLNYLSAPTNNASRTNTVTLESTDLAVDDKVLVTTYEDGNQYTVDSIVKADTVTGEVTAVKSRYDQNGVEHGKYAVMDDKQYDYVGNTFANDLADTALDDPTINAENTLYLDVYGNMIAFEATKRNVDYVYLDGAIDALGGINALATFADGTTSTIYVDEVDGQEKPSKSDMHMETSDLLPYEDGIYAYEKQGDAYQLITLTDANGAPDSWTNRPHYDTTRNVGQFDDGVSATSNPGYYYAIKNGTNAIQCTHKDAAGKVTSTQNVVSLTASTIFVDVDGGVIYTGYTNVPTMNDISFFVVYNRQDNADVVFITDGADNSTSDSFFYVTDAKPVTTQKDGTYYYEYSVMMNNEKTTITFKGTNKDSAKAPIAKDVLYKIDTITPDGYVKSASVVGAFGLNFSSSSNVATYADNGTLRVKGDSNIPNCGNGNLDNISGERIYAYNKDTQFVYIETKLDGSNTVSKTVGVGSANMINTSEDKLTGNNNVYVVAVDDKDARTPVATLVYIVEPVENVDNGFSPDFEVPAPAVTLTELANISEVEAEFKKGNNVIINGDWTANTDLRIPTGYVLKVNGDLGINGDDQIKNSGKLIVTGNLAVDAAQGTLTGTISAGSMTLNGNTTINADVTLGGNLTATNHDVIVSAGKTVLVDGDINLGANGTMVNYGHVEWTGNVTAKSWTDVKDNSSKGGTMTVETLTVGNGSDAGNVSVTALTADKITLTKGNAVVSGDLDDKNGGGITVTGSDESALTVSGDVKSNISVKDVNLSAGTVDGALTLDGTASAVVESATSITNKGNGTVTTTDSSADVTVKDTEIKANVTYAGDTTLSGKSITVNDGVTVTANGDLTISSSMTLKGTLVINGKLTGLDKISGTNVEGKDKATVVFGNGASAAAASGKFVDANGLTVAADKLAGKTFVYNAEKQKFVCEDETSLGILANALQHTYNDAGKDDYRTQDIALDGNTVTITLSEVVDEEAPRTTLMNTTARFLGAIYYANKDKVTSIIWNGETYKWYAEGKSKGSNWTVNGDKTVTNPKEDSNTLIYHIFGTTAKETDGYEGDNELIGAVLPGTINLTIDGQSVTIILKNATGTPNLGA